MKKSITCVLTNEEGKILVLEHKKCLGKYSLPAGTIEEGETSLETVLREMKEELNLNLDYEYLDIVREKYSWYKRTDGDQIYFETTYKYNKLIKEEDVVNMEPEKHPKLVWMTKEEIFNQPDLFTYNTWLIISLYMSGDITEDKISSIEKISKNLRGE